MTHLEARRRSPPLTHALFRLRDTAQLCHIAHIPPKLCTQAHTFLAHTDQAATSCGLRDIAQPGETRPGQGTTRVLLPVHGYMVTIFAFVQAAFAASAGLVRGGSAAGESSRRSVSRTRQPHLVVCATG